MYLVDACARASPRDQCYSAYTYILVCMEHDITFFLIVFIFYSALPFQRTFGFASLPQPRLFCRCDSEYMSTVGSRRTPPQKGCTCSSSGRLPIRRALCFIKKTLTKRKTRTLSNPMSSPIRETGEQSHERATSVWLTAFSPVELLE